MRILELKFALLSFGIVGLYFFHCYSTIPSVYSLLQYFLKLDVCDLSSVVYELTVNRFPGSYRRFCN